MKNKLNKPAFRNNFRMTLGRFYFTVKRYFEWCFDGKLYATNKVPNERLEYKISISQSPLRRALKNVDEYLNENKITNLKIAIEQINGIILKPQEVFSYWKLIGKPTKSKGYKEGFVLHNGKIAKEIGGGLCQLSNLIYWITLHTPLTITERWRHNYDVFPDAGRDRPFASGATCSFNYVDLQIKNTTQNNYQLILKLENDYLIGEWLSDVKQKEVYKVIEKDHEINHQSWGGYTRHNKLFKQIFNPENGEIVEEFICENHAIMMYEPLLTSGN